MERNRWFSAFRSTRYIAALACLALLVFAVGCAAGQETPELEENAPQVAEQLEQLRTTIEAETQENYPELASQVEQLREDLEQAYESRDMQEAWQEVEPQLDTLEEQLRSGSDEALVTLESVIEELRADLQPDAGS